MSIKKKLQVTIARALAFVMVFGALAASGDFLEAATRRVLSDWSNVAVGELSVSGSIYLQRLFDTPGAGYAGQAVDATVWPNQHFFVTSDNGADWHIQRDFASLIQAGSIFLGLNDGHLYRTDLGDTWERAPLPAEVNHPLRVSYNPGPDGTAGSIRLDYWGDNWQTGVMLSIDGGNTWFDYTDHLPQGVGSHNLYVLPDRSLFSFRLEWDDMTLHVYKSPGFTEDTQWTAASDMAVYSTSDEGRLGWIEGIHFTGNALALDLYFSNFQHVNWAGLGWDAPPQPDPLRPNNLVIATNDFENWQQTRWMNNPNDLPIAGLQWQPTVPAFSIRHSWAFDEAGVRHLVTQTVRAGGERQNVRIFLDGQQVCESFVPPVATASQAVPTAHNVTLNGEPVSPTAFNIGGNNFFMLRDIAYMLSDTWTRFDVEWDAGRNAIRLLRWREYTPVGGEMAAGPAGPQQALPTTADVLIGDTFYILTAFNIDGNNFFMLRDLGPALGFNVNWDQDTATIQITAN